MRLSKMFIGLDQWGMALVVCGLLLASGQQGFAQEFPEAEAAIKGKKFDQAITQLRTILQEKPKSHEAHYLLGLALKGKGQFDEALAEFQESAEHKKNFTDAWYELGMLQIETGKYDAAAASLTEGEARSKGKEPRFFYAQGLLEAKKGNFPEARNLMTKAQGAAPENPAYVRGLGDVYREMKVWGMAITQYNKALAMNPNSADAALTHYQLGKLHFESRQFNESVDEFKNAVAIDPGFADAWYQQGYILAIAKQYANAEAPLRKSVELQPNHFDTNYYLADVLYETKRIQMAVPFFEKALAVDPNNEKAVSCYPKLAEGLVAMGNYGKAVEAYKRAIAQKPDEFELIYGLGWVQSQAEVGDYTNGIMNLTKAIQLDPMSEKPHIQLALVYFDQNKYEDAIPHLQKAIELKPDDHNPYYYLGSAYVKQQQYDQAVGALQTTLNPAIERQTDEEARDKLTNVYATLGRELYAEKQYPASIAMFQQKIAYDSTSIATYQNMGLAALVSENYALARDTFQKEVTLASANEDTAALWQAKGFLGTSYIQLKDYKSARAIYQEIIQKNPNDAEAQYRMAFTYVVNKAYAQAIPHLRKAVEGEPGNASYHLLLAQCNLNAQQFDAAIQSYREVLKLQPDNGTAREQLQIAIDAQNATKK